MVRSNTVLEFSHGVKKLLLLNIATLISASKVPSRSAQPPRRKVELRRNSTVRRVGKETADSPINGFISDDKQKVAKY